MGVDFITCPICKENYADCGDELNWLDCHTICNDCLNDSNLGGEEPLCPICEKGVVLDEDLLSFIASELNLDLNEWRQKYKCKN